MKPDPLFHRPSRGEQEVENEAARLFELVEEALSAVSTRSTTEVDSLGGIADRIERASRDLSAALRELTRGESVTENTAG
jgi:hypothetical protein